MRLDNRMPGFAAFECLKCAFVVIETVKEGGGASVQNSR